MRVGIEPVQRLGSLELLDRGALRSRRAVAWCSGLPTTVGERELAVVRSELGWSDNECRLEQVRDAAGPGNAITLQIETDHLTAVFSGIGEPGRRAEQVARSATQAAATWLKSGVPVDEHLTDQLLLPMALGEGGRFRTAASSSHALTNAEVIRRFLGREIRYEASGNSMICHVGS